MQLNTAPLEPNQGLLLDLSENMHSVSPEAAEVADTRQSLQTYSLALCGRNLPDTDIRTEESRVKGEKQLLGDVSEHLDPTIPESRIP